MNKNNSIGALALGFTYAGCFFGAGYVSGQELWQFFGSFGKFGILGMVLSIFLFFIFGVLLTRSVQISGKTAFDDVLVPGNNKIISAILGIITTFLMFGVIVIMSAGAGSLIYQTFDISSFWGCALFTLLICISGLFGIKGIVRIFSYAVPVLVVATLSICIFGISKYRLQVDILPENNNLMLPNWWFSAINYVSYNIITLLGTIIPVSAYIKKKRTAYGGIFFGCFLATLLALGILLALNSMRNSTQTELPMLDVAFVLNSIFGYIYAMLLFIAMFGTALASFVAIIEYINEKFPQLKNHSTISIIALGIISFFCSLAGFGTLVGTVYPVFGYIGFLVLGLIIYNFIKLKINK